MGIHVGKALELFLVDGGDERGVGRRHHGLLAGEFLVKVGRVVLVLDLGLERWLHLRAAGLECDVVGGLRVVVEEIERE